MQSLYTSTASGSTFQIRLANYYVWNLPVRDLHPLEYYGIFDTRCPCWAHTSHLPTTLPPTPMAPARGYGMTEVLNPLGESKKNDILDKKVIWNI